MPVREVWASNMGARVAELVYAFDLKSNGENHMGSSPISGTIFLLSKNSLFARLFLR